MDADELDADAVDRRAVRRLASCVGKQAFDTYTLAEKIAKRNPKNGKSRRHREVYHCLNCHKFHLTEY